MRRELVNLVLFFACLLKVGCYTGLILVPAGFVAFQIHKFTHKGDHRHVVSENLN